METACGRRILLMAQTFLWMLSTIPNSLPAELTTARDDNAADAPLGIGFGRTAGDASSNMSQLSSGMGVIMPAGQGLGSIVGRQR